MIGATNAVAHRSDDNAINDVQLAGVAVASHGTLVKYPSFLWTAQKRPGTFEQVHLQGGGDTTANPEHIPSIE
jgi:hypothetical protein